MNDSLIVKNAIDTLGRLNVAASRIKLYPPASPLIRNSIDEVYKRIQDIHRQDRALRFEYEEVGNKVRVCGQLVKQNEYKRHIQFSGFINTLLGHGIFSLTMEKGLQKSELSDFLELMGKNPDETDRDEAFVKAMEENLFPNISLVNKRLAASYQDIHISMDMGLPEVQAALARILMNTEKASSEQISGNIVQMLRSLSQAAGAEEKGRLSNLMALSMKDSDADVLVKVLKRQIDPEFDDAFFDELTNGMDDERFRALALNVGRMQMAERSADEGGGAKGEDSVAHVAEKLLKSERFQKIRQEINEQLRREKQEKEALKARLALGFEKLMKGDDASLSDPRLVVYAGGKAIRMLSRGKIRGVEEILRRLCEGLLNDDPAVRQSAARVVSDIWRRLDADAWMQTRINISRKLMKYVRFETERSPEYEKIAYGLKNLIQDLIRGRRFSEATPVLEGFNRMFYRSSGEGADLRDMAGEILEAAATDEIMGLLMEEFHTNARQLQNQAAQCLTLMGPPSAAPLLELLHNSENRSERAKCVRILSKIGPPPPSALIERLEQGGEWYYIRNLILILGKTGTAKEAYALRPYLTSPHVRIHREALQSIFNIGGPDRCAIFLSAFSQADDALKPAFIDMFGALKCTDAVGLLLDVFRSKLVIGAKERRKPVEKACAALGKIGDEKAEPHLKAMMEEIASSGNAQQEWLAKAAGDALSAIQKNRPAEREGRRTADDGGALNSAAAGGETALKGEVVAGDDDLLDDLALAKLIEDEADADAGPPRRHADVWQDLYASLTRKEAAVLQGALKESEYKRDQAVFKQGDLNSNLYFVNRGGLKLVHEAQDEEFLIHVLGPGDMAGNDTFFSISACTASLIPLSSAHLSVLEKRDAADWEKTAPELEGKLIDFSLKYEKVSDLIKKKGINRRAGKRVSAKGKVLMQLAGASGKPVGKVSKGDLLDISVQGVSFLIRTQKKETPGLLLGRKLLCRVVLDDARIAPKIDRIGLVVGVRYLLFNEYAVHLRFEKNISPKLIKAVAAASS